MISSCYPSTLSYADDTTFYISDRNPSQLHNLLTADIAMIEQWCTSNQMVINTSKSHFLAMDSKTPSSFKFSILADPLSERSTFKLFGFTITNDLSWKSHILDTSKKLSQNLRLMYNIRHFLSFKTALFFYNNFIHSYLSYGIHLYYSMTLKSQTKQLYDIQKKALRLVCKPYQRPKKTLSNA